MSISKSTQFSVRRMRQPLSSFTHAPDAGQLNDAWLGNNVIWWYPERFASIDEARVWMRAFVAWYNTEHRHSGIGLCRRRWCIAAKRRSRWRRARRYWMSSTRAPGALCAWAAEPALVPTAVGINLPHPRIVAVTPVSPGGSQQWMHHNWWSHLSKGCSIRSDGEPSIC
jgi:Integrase core domain